MLVGTRPAGPSQTRHHPPRIHRYPPLLRARHSSSSSSSSSSSPSAPDTSLYIDTLTDEPPPAPPSTPPPPAPTGPLLTDPSQHNFYHRKPRQHIAAPTDDAEVVRFFERLFFPLEFPRELALRMITHASWKTGREGHNGRLIFLGRRVLRANTFLFLQSKEVHKPESKYEVPPWDDEISAAVLDALDTHSLGHDVGRVWQLERVMRWVPVLPDSTQAERVLYSSGLFKVRGTVVESVMGGIFHQYGALLAQRAFQTRVLPHLVHRFPRPYAHEALELAERMGGTNAPMMQVSPEKAAEMRNMKLEREPERAEREKKARAPQSRILGWTTAPGLRVPQGQGQGRRRAEGVIAK